MAGPPPRFYATPDQSGHESIFIYDGEPPHPVSNRSVMSDTVAKEMVEELLSLSDPFPEFTQNDQLRGIPVCIRESMRLVRCAFENPVLDRQRTMLVGVLAISAAVGAYLLYRLFKSLDFGDGFVISNI